MFEAFIRLEGKQRLNRYETQVLNWGRAIRTSGHN
jgi:hypothetical protein